MIQYTTTSIAFTVSDIDLTDKHVWVTLSDSKHKLTFENPQMSYSDPDTNIVIQTRQEDSGRFPAGTHLKVQVNYMTSDGVRKATSKGVITVEENLLDKVLSYD